MISIIKNLGWFIIATLISYFTGAITVRVLEMLSGLGSYLSDIILTSVASITITCTIFYFLHKKVNFTIKQIFIIALGILTPYVVILYMFTTGIGMVI